MIWKVLSYLDVLRDKAPVGDQVAIIGCGGIGFDTAMYFHRAGRITSQNIARFCNELGDRQQPTTGWWLTRRECRSRVAHGKL